VVLYSFLVCYHADSKINSNLLILTTMNQTPKGLIASIYRDEYKCRLNKLDNFQSVVVIDPELDPIFEPKSDMPAVRLVRHTFFGKPYIHAEPMEPGMYMFGGSFIYSSDSRLNAINKYPIPLHDRQE